MRATNRRATVAYSKIWYLVLWDSVKDGHPNASEYRPLVSVALCYDLTDAKRISDGETVRVWETTSSAVDVRAQDGGPLRWAEGSLPMPGRWLR